MTKLFPYCFVLLVICSIPAHGQTITDSSGKKIEVAAVTGIVDSAVLNHSPRKAAIRSAILPGLGQVYNKKYWKLPIVYGALGTAGGIFMYNLNWYKRFRYAYKVLYTKDSANFPNIYHQLQSAITLNDVNYLRVNRDEFRRNVDYSVLAFIVLWGLNVVDASVDAHLRSFDVSPDLSFEFKAGYSDLANTNGISLVLHFK